MVTIPVANLDLTGNEKRYLNEAFDSGILSFKGEFVKRFENLFSSKHYAKYGIACINGTSALTLALRAIGIREGDEVIVPEFTMIASAWAVNYAFAKPIFVDCDDNFLIDVEKIREKITNKTKVIMPVHIYGRQCNMKEIKKIAYEYNLRVIEDSCESHGLPLSGDIACFSLYGNKIISSGEGGICITNDEFFAKQLEHLRSMAFDEKHSFIHNKFAYNFRLSNLQAAIALAQTERLEEFLHKRTIIENWYDENLKDIPQIKILPKRNYVWMYDILAENRDKLMTYLLTKGIETRRFFEPMSAQNMYRTEDYKKLKAYEFSKKGLYLPTYINLCEREIKYIVNQIKKFYEKD